MHPGQRVGPYLVRRRVAAGGMGRVFAAMDGDEREVAIKVLHREHLLQPELVMRFFHEARLPRLLAHPGIVKILDEGVLPDGAPYLVMEYLDETLAQRLATGPLPESVALPVALAVAGALAAAHAEGVIHRDLRPENVMFTRAGDLRVVDFGLAKITSGAQSMLGGWPVSTAGDDLLGTREYRAPEQWISSKRVDARVDVYSLGAMLHQMLSGACPFVAESESGAMDLHLFAPPPPLPACAPPVAALVRRMLAKAPEERPAMPEAADAIAGLLDGLTGTAR